MTRFKNNSFHRLRVDSHFWKTITLYTVHFQHFQIVMLY